jgi:acylphosphatase
MLCRQSSKPSTPLPEPSVRNNRTTDPQDPVCGRLQAKHPVSDSKSKSDERIPAAREASVESKGEAPSIRCRRFRVSGRVQGVFFRDSTRQQALKLGLTGNARNMPDGSVEVLACGRAGALGTLERWLQSGPPMASVANVDSTDVENQSFRNFTIA